MNLINFIVKINQMDTRYYKELERILLLKTDNTLIKKQE